MKRSDVMTSYNSLNKRGTCAKVVFSILASFMDIGILCFACIMEVFLNYLIHGLSWDAIMKHGPNIQTEVAVTNCFTLALMDYEKWSKFNKRQSVYVVWILYYPLVLTLSIIENHASIWVIKHVWFRAPDLDKNIYNMVGFRQTLIFLFITVHNCWFDGIFLRNVDPVAAGVLLYCLSWFVWSVYIGAIFSVDDRAQVGPFMQYMILINIWNGSVYKQLHIKFKNIGTKAGWVGFGVITYSAVHYAISYLILWGLYGKPWVDGTMTPDMIGTNIWGMAAVTWIPMEIFGHRLTPLFFKKMCVRSGTKFGYSYGGLVVYSIIVLLYEIGVGAILYIFFNFVVYDNIYCKHLIPSDQLVNYPNCQKGQWNREYAIIGYGCGAMYVIYLTSKARSRDAVVNQSCADEVVVQNRFDPEAVCTAECVPHSDLISHVDVTE